MKDKFRYRLPFELFGDLAQWYVNRELKYVFDYRYKIVEQIFTPKFNLLAILNSFVKLIFLLVQNQRNKS